MFYLKTGYAHFLLTKVIAGTLRAMLKFYFIPRPPYGGNPPREGREEGLEMRLGEYTSMLNEPQVIKISFPMHYETDQLIESTAVHLCCLKDHIHLGFHSKS